MAEQKTPKASDTVEVTPVTTPVRHAGELKKIGEAFEAEWRHVEGLVSAGIAKLEKIVGKPPAGKSAGDAKQ